MPQAFAAETKYAWMDHDPAYLNQIPVQNTWYIVAHVYDFRELLFAVKYDDDEHNAPTYQIRRTVDGTTYYTEEVAEDNAQIYFSKNKYPSTGGTLGLGTRVPYASPTNFYDDKRGLDGLFEVRITNAVGTNPILNAWLLYETLEQT